jgi:cyclopropane-fatty-acyl-phospholipid synthase
MFEGIVKNKFLKSLEKIVYGELCVSLPEGNVLVFKGDQEGQHVDLQIEDWRTIVNLSFKGDVGFAEDYRDGYWHTSDLTALIIFALENESVLDSYIDGNFFFQQLSKISYLTKRNTLKGSKKNIHDHYDLGNDFYELWLDPTMTYSSALYKGEGESLEQAQYNKYDRIIDKIDPSGKILEVGCGWGGFASRALDQHDYEYKGITLSTEQRKYAAQKLPGNGNFVLEDYRHQKGQYDSIVSIEMFEAVGQSFWPTYFKKLKSLLKSDGKALIQSIVIADDVFDQYRKGADMIRTFIFPGGMLPSVEQLRKQVNNVGMEISDMHAFGKDYATTLKEWLVKFTAHESQLVSMGYDKSFQRMWRFYLASCIATFSTSRTDVIQLELQHG